MNDRNELDLDIEQFNPKISRRRYEKLGYPEGMINSLVAIDTLLYNKPVEEVRAALAKQKNADS